MMTRTRYHLRNDLRRVIKGLALLFCALAGADHATAQISTASGFYYPVLPKDNYNVGYHKIGGTISGSNGFGGHFMAPSYQRIDPQTGGPGLYLDPYYHNGMDIMANYGTPVFAIADGVIPDSISTGGWTSGGTVNVAVIILHTTNTGQQFKAVYGHLEKATVDTSKIYVGANVTRGQLIGRVGTWSNGDHLHFGIHPGSGSLPFFQASAENQSYGYGRIGINYWVGSWPNRMNWADPVLFIETNCPAGTVGCPTNDLVAKSDMKEYMIGRVNPSLTTDNVNFGFLNQDQYYEYRYQWFYALEGSHVHWFLVSHATFLYSRSVRYVGYKDWDNQQFYGWRQVLVIP
jgi:murein DD-endopeptidase MepM/ murein hydrolase activator NlpD